MSGIKVLLSAYACEPGRGSEPGVGWNTAREIAKYHEVWVLVSLAYRSNIEAALAANPIPNLHFVYFDPLNWTYDWSREGKGILWTVNLHYYLWQVWAYFVGRSLHRQINFDLAHHVTYVRYWNPSFLALLSIPFIWGPVGGGEAAPRSFWKNFSLRGKVFELLRTIAGRLGELDPFTRLTAQRSTISFAATEDTASRMRQIGAKNVHVLSQVGLLQEELESLHQYIACTKLPTRFISIGRLLHWKGFDLGLRAFAQANLPAEYEYWIIGCGAEAQRLQTLAQELGIGSQVKFLEHLPRAEIFHRLGESLALVHPSLHESGGFVCLEAMAAGCPVICLDLGGPAVQVTEETGFKVSASQPDEAILGMMRAMRRLANEPELRDRLSEASQRRVDEVFNWNQKGQFWSHVYEKTLSLLSQVNSHSPVQSFDHSPISGKNS